ncbi:MAG: hypothetical protein ACI8Z7_000471 [Candidatus Nanohaloarchaea archaeon]|jgi:hypothetical protein
MEFNDLLEQEIENSSNPRNPRNIVEGIYSDVEVVSEDELRGQNKHLRSSIWNSQENIFISDHHTKPLMPWMIAGNKWKGDDILLAHIDLHRDRKSYRANPELLRDAYKSGDFLEFSRLGFVSEVMDIVEEFGLADEVCNWGSPVDKPSNHPEDLSPVTESYDRFILDVDLDVFKGIENQPPKGDWELNDVYSKISDLEQRADLTTYVTSPGFIDQEKAVNYLENIREY